MIPAAFDYQVADSADAAIAALAEHGDDGTTDSYPDFDKFFGPINTDRADNRDIRRMIRKKLRRIAQDQRGREFACDYPEDLQLQRAISIMLEKLGAVGAQIDEYAAFLTALGPVAEPEEAPK